MSFYLRYCDDELDDLGQLYTVVLVGMPGTGKSSVGTRLSRVLGGTFVDTDVLMEHRMGKRCDEIYASLGEKDFRALEAETIAAALADDEARRPRVIALGGGAVVTPSVREALRGRIVVWIDVSIDEGVIRSRGGTPRPILQADDASVQARYRQLYNERKALYAKVATTRIDTTYCTLDHVVSQVVRALQTMVAQHESSACGSTPEHQLMTVTTRTRKGSHMGQIYRTINVATAQPYSVVIGTSLAGEVVECVKRQPDARCVAILTQPTVIARARTLDEALRAEGFTVDVIEVPDAEAGKTIEECARLWDRLGAGGWGRRDLVISVGGGACTDLAGYVAACWMRGMKVIHCPTTVLAMVDAAVGGKTGVNTAAGKNLVGAFHEPAGVFIDMDALGTLSKEDLISGSAEIIKTGFIRDPEILRLYEASPERCMDRRADLPELIARSVTVKAEVVAQDLRESHLREILNYGHTFGHAIERAEDFRWRHGNAVAVGMMYVAHLAAIRGELSDGIVEQHRRLLASVGLPTSYEGATYEELLGTMRKDKKTRAGALRFVGLRDVGETDRIEDATEKQLEEAYRRTRADATKAGE